MMGMLPPSRQLGREWLHRGDAADSLLGSACSGGAACSGAHAQYPGSVVSPVSLVSPRVRPRSAADDDPRWLTAGVPWLTAGRPAQRRSGRGL
jgi:hypothetical protein